MYAVIMAGGQGTRLWPVSRINKPKQFHSFNSDKPLVRETFERLLPKINPDHIFISTTREYASEIKKQLPEIDEANFIIEPLAQGTAASCGLCSKILFKQDPNATAIFLPSDHMIRDVDKFLETIDFAEHMIEKYPRAIITLGIKPNKPNTSLGYIHMEEQISKNSNFSVFSVKEFVEKPNLETAKEYIRSWNFLWNSGIFIWKVSNLMDLISLHLPKTSIALENIYKSIGTQEENDVLQSEYGKVDITSIDYGILEKTNEILVIPSDFGWSDIGSWSSLLEFYQDTHKSDVISKGHHVGLNDRGCLFLSNDKLIATIGLRDTIIVDSHDAILVCNRKYSSDVKTLLEKLREEGKHLYL